MGIPTYRVIDDNGLFYLQKGSCGFVHLCLLYLSGLWKVVEMWGIDKSTTHYKNTFYWNYTLYASVMHYCLKIQ